MPVTLRGHQSSVLCVAWHPEGKKLASGGGDHRITIWDCKQDATTNKVVGTKVRTLNHPTNAVYDPFVVSTHAISCIAWRPDGVVLASGDQSGNVMIWVPEYESNLNPNGSQIDNILPNSSGYVHCLVWSNGNDDVPSDLMSGSKTFQVLGGDVKIWPIDAEISLINPYKDMDCLNLSLGYGYIEIQPDGDVDAFKAPIRSIACNYEDKILAVAVKQIIQLWNLNTEQLHEAAIEGEPEYTIQFCREHPFMDSEVYDLKWHPHQNILAICGCVSFIKMWNYDTHSEHVLTDQHTNTIEELDSIPWINLRDSNVDNARNTVAFNRDGRFLASGTIYGIVEVWDWATSTMLRVLRGHTGPIISVSWNPINDLLASGSGDGTVKVWREDEGSLARKRDVIKKILTGKDEIKNAVPLPTDLLHYISNLVVGFSRDAQTQFQLLCT